MRLYGLWCRTWLRPGTWCALLPAGCLWPVGAALCVHCCPPHWHGTGSTHQGGE